MVAWKLFDGGGAVHVDPPSVVEGGVAVPVMNEDVMLGSVQSRPKSRSRPTLGSVVDSSCAGGNGNVSGMCGAVLVSWDVNMPGAGPRTAAGSGGVGPDTELAGSVESTCGSRSGLLPEL